ncbi:MAG TPA: DUF4446 family protein [Candidatus Limnocylindria bacterium]|nr:DUF4446 family protein [Candidatus Limnocylindria bacterium]
MPAELQGPIALAALIVALLSLLLSLLLVVRLRRATRQGRLPASGVAHIDRLLGEEVRRLDAVSDALAQHASRLHLAEDGIRRSVQRVGVVRYNPFQDTGGNQSFALAMLDNEANGVVLSSLHSRQVTRLYLKQIVAGRSETALSEEEAEALRRAGSTAHERG